VLISKDAKRLTLYAKVRSFPVATGKNTGDKRRAGDCRTPETPPGALDPIVRKLRTPEGSQFGPRFLLLSTPPWQGIAVHGTNAPSSIGTDASHGCVRLHNPDILSLFGDVRVGDPVLITR
jgi:lipoprotein-anchoring transpeptidase ErfK/SrfK